MAAWGQKASPEGGHNVTWEEPRVEADGWALNEAHLVASLRAGGQQPDRPRGVLILNTGQRTDCNLCTVAPALLWQHPYKSTQIIWPDLAPV